MTPLEWYMVVALVMVVVSAVTLVYSMHQDDKRHEEWLDRFCKGYHFPEDDDENVVK